MPHMVVWQCLIWQCHVRIIVSATHGRVIGNAKSGSFTYGRGSATNGSLAVPNLAVPRMEIWQCLVYGS